MPIKIRRLAALADPGYIIDVNSLVGIGCDDSGGATARIAGTERITIGIFD
jgi:hypothetical protein